MKMYELLVYSLLIVAIKVKQNHLIRDTLFYSSFFQSHISFFFKHEIGTDENENIEHQVLKTV